MAPGSQQPGSASGSALHNQPPSTERNHNEHELAVLLCSRDNGHWALVLYPVNTDRGRVFHVRNSDSYDPDKFFYEERDQLIEMDGVFGRSVLGTMYTTERSHAESIIRDFALIDENIPRFSDGRNCQTFVTEMLRRLEEVGLLPDAESRRYFEKQHRRRGTEIAASLQRGGRSWIERAVHDRQAPADAKYTPPDRVPRPRRKLDTEAFANLLGPSSAPT